MKTIYDTIKNLTPYSLHMETKIKKIFQNNVLFDRIRVVLNNFTVHSE